MDNRGRRGNRDLASPDNSAKGAGSSSVSQSAYEQPKPEPSKVSFPDLQRDSIDMQEKQKSRLEKSQVLISSLLYTIFPKQKRQQIL